MISHTAQQLADLKAPHEIVHLVKFQIDATWYYLCDTDAPIDYLGNTYVPGYLDKLDDIEVTSEPKTGDTDIELHAHDNSFVSLLLSGKWMNKPLTIYKLRLKPNGSLILGKVAFEGLLSDYELDAKDDVTATTASSIWADYEKIAAIFTNLKSQQRFYPNDTAFRHSSDAMKKIYWGKDAPRVTFANGGGGRFGAPVDLP